MLGEAARTDEDALRYFEAYSAAIKAVGAANAGRGEVGGPGISVACRRCIRATNWRSATGFSISYIRAYRAAIQAKDVGIGFTIDAEEAARLDLSLDVIEALSADPALAGWDGLGLAVQAYQKRAYAVLQWLAEIAPAHKRRWMVRLVKGAYWDTEIKLAQEQGLDNYRCSRANPRRIFPISPARAS